MSRIGKLPIKIPAGVKVDVQGNKVQVEGPKGKLNWVLPARASLKVEDGQVIVARKNDERESRAVHGLARSLVNNMVIGVSDGFVKRLEINGVGFKAAVEGKVVDLALGYSHPIKYNLPDNVTVQVEGGGTKLTIEGPDKQAVGCVAAEIRSYYPPEPYKGKGVKYDDERIVRKEGKSVK